MFCSSTCLASHRQREGWLQQAAALWPLHYSAYVQGGSILFSKYRPEPAMLLMTPWTTLVMVVMVVMVVVMVVMVMVMVVMVVWCIMVIITSSIVIIT